MGLLLLWACFLAVLAGIGVTVRVLVLELRRQLQTRQEPVEQPAAEVAPRRVTLSAQQQAPAVAPAQRTGRGLAYLLPSPQVSTG